MAPAPFYLDLVRPGCLRNSGINGAARWAAERLETQLLQTLEGLNDTEGWEIRVELTLHRHDPIKAAARAARAARPGNLPREL